MLNCIGNGSKFLFMLKFIPNMLTFVRLALAVVVQIMILCSPPLTNKAIFLGVAFVLFVIAELTDVVDGFAARKFNASSKFGRVTDPLADKILVCGTFICFAIIGEPKLFGLGRGALAAIHWSVVAILVVRETYVTIIRHVAEARGTVFPSVMAGKIKGVIQAFAIGTVIIKMAYVPTAAWGDWFTVVAFLIMLVYTIRSGLMASQRTGWIKTA